MYPSLGADAYPGRVPLVVYSLLRIALFGVALVALWALGMGGWLLVAVAAVTSTAVSYLALRRPRDAAALWLAERAERRRATGTGLSAAIDDDAAAEDAVVDQTEVDQIARPRPSSTP